MKTPYYAFFSLLLLLALLLLFSATIPELGLRITSGQDTLALRFASLDQAFGFHPATSREAEQVLDQLLADETLTDTSLTPDWRDYRKSSTEYADTGKNPLFLDPEQPNGSRALDAFFDGLWRLEHQEGILVRIEHYGDSQIEGDRITHYLRTALQKEFGGSGLGLVPFMDVASHHIVTRRQSGQWKRYNVFNEKYKNGDYNLGGVLFAFAGGGEGPSSDSALTGGRRRRRAQAPDSEAVPRRPIVTGPLDLKASTTFNLNRLAFGQARLLLGNVPGPCALSAEADGTTYFSDTLMPGNGIRLVNLGVKSGVQSLTLSFAADQSPDIFGLLLDGKAGIQVDNLGIRGHSGDGLQLIDFKTLKAQYDSLDTRLIVLQYGGNAVPMDNVTDWSFFEDALYRLLRRLQRAAPNASILVVGVGDAAKRKAGEYQTYHTVPRIRDAQRKAAQRAGVAFWDLYQAMGGKNSIVSWVERGLAGHDYAHFSGNGQRLVANMLLKVLFEEYNKYRDERETATARVNAVRAAGREE